MIDAFLVIVTSAAFFRLIFNNVSSDTNCRLRL